MLYEVITLAAAYLDGEFDQLVAQLKDGSAREDALDDDPLVRELELICREFSKERRIGPDDNLFEVGVSRITSYNVCYTKLLRIFLCRPRRRRPAGLVSIAAHQVSPTVR